LPIGVADANPPLTLAGVPLGVLDLAPEALRATIDLAKRTEELGFTRFWVAEHHDLPGVASSSRPA
jgi:alkanesulfonate monooxygenase SsuD/methylene tetrahydromethanopterin reductase-like flavin-dependent oxidoreductase (luciferase family)